MTKHGMSRYDRLMLYVVVPAVLSDCWIWVGHFYPNGYGKFRPNNDLMTCAHRVMYEEAIGPIPDGWDVGHKCHDEAAAAGLCQPENNWDCPHRACVNPAHLKAEPRGANLLASPLTQAAINKAKTECKRGHPFDEENTGWKQGKWRYCKACNKMGKKGRTEWDRMHA